MESIYLKTLVAIVKLGGLSKAADALCVTQPAVSKRIKFMEEQYGCALLERVGNTLHPTEAGRLVMEKAEILLGIETEMLMGLNYLSGKKSISFCCTPAFGISHLPNIMNEFMLHYADRVDMKFIFEIPVNIVNGLREGLFDLAVIEHCVCFDLAGLSIHPLPDDSMVFLSSPELGISSPLAQLEQLTGKTLFARKEGCCSRILLENNLKQIGRDMRDFKRVVVFDDLQVIIKAIMDGDGIAFLSRDLVSGYINTNRLVEHHIAGFTHNRNRSLVFNGKDSRNTCVDHFTDMVCRYFNLPAFSSRTTPLIR